MNSERAPKPPAVEKDGDAAAMQRRYKQVEGDHREWQEQVQKELRRQKLELDALKRDNEQYKQQLNELRVTEAATSIGTGSLANPNSRGAKRSKEMEAKRETLVHLETKIRNEQVRAQDLDRQIDETRGMLKMARKSRNGVNVTQEGHEMINRQVQVLENRLDQSLQKFNEALRQNKELRDQIDTLRGERDVFDTIYQKLEAELQEKKKEMAFIIELSNIAYEERDNNIQVLNNLKEFAKDEMDSFVETFRELDELLEEDRKMKEQVKARVAALEKREKSSDAKQTEEENSKRKAASAQKQAAGSEKAQETIASQIAMYEEAFMKIREHTDIPDLQDVVQRFLHAEEANFSLFSFVNDLTKEVESLEKQRSELLTEIAKTSSGNEAEQERRKALQSLEDRLHTEEQKNSKYLAMSQKTEGILHHIMNSVESIFSKIGADDTHIIEQHGIATLTLESLLLYLAAIELRADEYMTAWAKSGPDGVVQRGPIVAVESAQILVDAHKLPQTGEDADGSEEDDHPLSREELLRKAQKKMSTQQFSATERRPVRSKPKVVGLPMKKANIREQ